MNQIYKKSLSYVIVSVFIFVIIFSTSNSARAYWGVLDTVTDIPNTISGYLQYAEEIMNYEELYGNDIKEWAKREAVNAVKKAAMNAIQKKLKNSAASKMITNYSKYLYSDPMNKTSKQMDSFYNSISGGTNSSLNYEGVGSTSNYSAYLVAQAKKSIEGVSLKATITDVVSDPTKPFSSGNMQGLMISLECANNPYCVSIASQSKYNQLLEKNQTIAEKEQVNGYLPTKVNGIITSAANSAANQAVEVAQMGVDAVVNAINNDDSSEDLIAAGEDYITQLTDETSQSSTDDSSNEDW